MGNSKELRDARRNAAHYAWVLARVEALPRRVGQQVTWRNGTVWQRVGDDAWRPIEYLGNEEWTYSSAHIASGTRAEEE